MTRRRFLKDSPAEDRDRSPVIILNRLEAPKGKDTGIEVETDSSSTSSKRGRAHQIISEIGAKMKAAKEAKEAERESEREENLERSLSDRSIPPLSKKAMQEHKEQVEEIWKEFKMNSTPDIAAIILEQVDVVIKIATKSGNIKGTWQKYLKDASAKMKAAATLLGERAREIGECEDNPRKLARELEEIRRELHTLREENKRLREETQEIREEEKLMCNREIEQMRTDL